MLVAAIVRTTLDSAVNSVSLMATLVTPSVGLDDGLILLTVGAARYR